MVPVCCNSTIQAKVRVSRLVHMERTTTANSSDAQARGAMERNHAVGNAKASVATVTSVATRNVLPNTRR